MRKTRFLRGPQVFRVHHVRAAVQSLRMLEAVEDHARPQALAEMSGHARPGVPENAATEKLLPSPIKSRPIVLRCAPGSVSNPASRAK